MSRLIFILLTTVAFSWSKASIANSEVTTYFGEKLNIINSFLAKSHDKAVKQPELLVEFVDKELLTIWSAKNTLRAMLGPKRWAGIAPQERIDLINTYKNTIRRYLYEVLQQYRGQKALVNDLRLNSKGNKGWLSVLLESPNFPDLNIDLKIYKDSSVWTVYDFSFQGISFVKMKRRFFRDTFDQQGADGIIKALKHKNNEFNQMLAAQ
ncbi:MlaC/ttg2D family ABC transporter substrate-binding protein [Kangiella shandongensis]|uniref:MlaC/ttg2D family ABC transporter substrate-binding protein n=1 Tax=Kangiella shandongensis TaxID=2763258 RepID=UPI001CBE9486|nr:ABC transporter substrate-binding protein [Kangiella shandongensis]